VLDPCLTLSDHGTEVACVGTEEPGAGHAGRAGRTTVVVHQGGLSAAAGTADSCRNDWFGLDVGQEWREGSVGVDKKFLIAFETACQNHTAHPRGNCSLQRMTVEKWRKLELAVVGLVQLTEVLHWDQEGGAPCLGPYDHGQA